MDKKFHFSLDAQRHNNIRLTNQIFKLLPMYENGEDWNKQLETIVLELKGYNDIFEDSPEYLVLIAKLYALKYAENQVDFRKLIFEAITQLKLILAKSSKEGGKDER